MNNLKEKFAKNLAKRLEDTGINCSQLAKAVGVSRTSAMYWCNGRNLPRLDKVNKIAGTLNCTVDELFEGVFYAKE